MEGLDVEYFPNTNKKSLMIQNMNLIHIQLMTINNMLVIHLLAWFIYSINALKLGILVSGFLTVWEGTDGREKKYRCALDIYLTIVL